MSTLTETSNPSLVARSGSWPVGWIQVVLASVAMTATLPGRTHGLGLITEPLLTDLHIDRPFFGWLNFAACLLGSLCCLPVGRWLDRRGVRVVLTCVALLLAAAVGGMAAAIGPISLFVSLVCVRGLGQSALSVVSLAMVGKWFPKRSGPAMGLFAVLLTFGFITSILGLGELVRQSGWRAAWSGLAAALVLGLAPLGWLLARNPQEDDPTFVPDEPATPPTILNHSRDVTLREALGTPTFWIFGFGVSLFNLVWSGLTLFNESILVERGFTPLQAVELLSILTGTGLLANLICGGLLRREHLGFWLASGLALLAANLGWFPQISSVPDLRLYAAMLGVAGGIITVVFFAGWGQLFGRTHLGHIQGAAQAATVVASAVGPVLFAEGQSLLGRYDGVFRGLSVVALAAAIAALTIRAPHDAETRVGIP